MVTFAKIPPKIVNSIDIAGNSEEYTRNPTESKTSSNGKHCKKMATLIKAQKLSRQSAVYLFGGETVNIKQRPLDADILVFLICYVVGMPGLERKWHWCQHWKVSHPDLSLPLIAELPILTRPYKQLCYPICHHTNTHIHIHQKICRN